MKLQHGAHGAVSPIVCARAVLLPRLAEADANAMKASKVRAQAGNSTETFSPSASGGTSGCVGIITSASRAHRVPPMSQAQASQARGNRADQSISASLPSPATQVRECSHHADAELTEDDSTGGMPCQAKHKLRPSMRCDMFSDLQMALSSRVGAQRSPWL